MHNKVGLKIVTFLQKMLNGDHIVMDFCCHTGCFTWGTYKAPTEGFVLICLRLNMAFMADTNERNKTVTTMMAFIT